MKFIAIILAILFLVGCARSSVVPIGDETYVLTRAQKGFTTTAVREEALKEAHDHCAAKGKTTEILGVDVTEMIIYTADPEATVSFKCVSAE